MKAVWKYPVLPGAFVWQIPAGARIVDVEMQNGAPQMWALVDPDPNRGLTAREFYTAITGEEIADRWGYVGTFRPEAGIVAHLFEVLA